MKLLSINVGRPRLVQQGGRTVSTAIFKHPISGPACVTRLGVEGDDQADKNVHGGVDKAVYAYTEENYAWWRERLPGLDLLPGQFGENFTVIGMPDDQVAVGDRYRVGTAVFEVTQPRTPCMKLGLKMQMPAFVKQFHQAARVGFYLRVIEEGTTAAGAAIEQLARDAGNPTIAALYQLMYFSHGEVDAYLRTAELPALSEAWREQFLEKAGERGP